MGKSVMFRMRKHGKRHWTEKFRYFFFKNGTTKDILTKALLFLSMRNRIPFQICIEQWKMGLSHDDRFLYKGTSHFPSITELYIFQGEPNLDWQKDLHVSNDEQKTRFLFQQGTIHKNGSRGDFGDTKQGTQEALVASTTGIVVMSKAAGDRVMNNIYIYMYHSQEQIHRLQWCTQLILVMVSVVYAPYEHQSVDADTTNGSLKNDKTHVPFHVTRLD